MPERSPPQAGSDRAMEPTIARSVLGRKSPASRTLFAWVPHLPRVRWRVDAVGPRGVLASRASATTLLPTRRSCEGTPWRTVAVGPRVLRITFFETAQGEEVLPRTRQHDPSWRSPIAPLLPWMRRTPRNLLLLCHGGDPPQRRIRAAVRGGQPRLTRSMAACRSISDCPLKASASQGS